MKSVFMLALATVLSLGLSATKAVAQTQNDSLAKLHMLYLVGVEAGNIGHAKACKDNLKKFSLRMSGNYGFANKKLRTFADQNNFTLNVPPFTATETQNIDRIQAEFLRVRELKDCSFDAQFIKILKESHAFALTVANGVIAQESGKVKAFLSSALPLLKANVSEIETLK